MVNIGVMEYWSDEVLEWWSIGFDHLTNGLSLSVAPLFHDPNVFQSHLIF